MFRPYPWACAIALCVLWSTPGLAAQPSMTAGRVLQDSRVTLSFGNKCGQHKLAFVGGRWWGVLTTSNGVDFYSLDRATQQWTRATFADSHVTSDTVTRADVIWTGQNLVVLTDERVSGVVKLRLRAYDYVAPGFTLRAGPSDVVTGLSDDTFTANVQTVVVDSAGRAWVSYRSGTGAYVKGSSGTGPAGWTSWASRVVLGNLEGGLGDTPGYGVLVTFTGKVGFVWCDQRAGSYNGFKFRWRPDAASPTATWSAEELAQGEGVDLADDHLNVQSYEGRVFVAVKTNFNKVGRAILELLRRDVDGTWHVWNVVVNDGTWRTVNVTRPILVLEPGRRLVHYFYNNGGGIVHRETSIDAPDFSAPPDTVIASPDAAWNSQSTSQYVDATTGLVVGCDLPQSVSTWTCWGEVPLSASTTGALASITITPDPATVAVGESVKFQAIGHDASGNVVPVAPLWEAEGGTITADGLYTGETTGTHGVTAKQDPIVGHATVNVVAARILTRIVVTPNPASTQPGGTVTFAAEARDQDGAAMSGVVVSWSASAGTIDATGRWTAPASEGAYDVTASSAGIVGHATANVAAVTEVIVDDGQPGFTVSSGKWYVHYQPYRYGSTDRTNDTGALGSCRWAANLAPATYDVYAWVPSRYPLTTSRATYTIATTTGAATVSLDQAPSALWGTWVKVGTYSLDGSAAVTISPANSGQVVAADAIRFVRVAP